MDHGVDHGMAWSTGGGEGGLGGSRRQEACLLLLPRGAARCVLESTKAHAARARTPSCGALAEPGLRALDVQDLGEESTPAI